MDKIEELLTRGVANIIPNKEELRKLLAYDKKLNVYLGIDPTATKIHLGHALILRKLNEFAKLGHNVTFLIGDFTALIGDTSDKDRERPVLTPEQIQENFKTYKKQAGKILDFSIIQVRNNSEWLDKLSPRKVIELCQKFSLNDFVSRELITKRFNQGSKVALHEVLYPAIQGYDSYFLDTDIQIGGADQTFNMQAGRTLQKIWRNKESFVLTTEYLMGTDGRKMSKSWGNAIWLDDNSNDMFAKIMAINDDLIDQYFTLGTNIDINKIEALKAGKNPMGVKKELAFEIVKELHGEKEALTSQNNFEQTVQHEELPDDIPIFQSADNQPLEIVDLLVKTKLAESRANAKRLIEQGGVTIENKVIKQNEQISLKENLIIRVGKRRFIKVKIDPAALNS